MAADPGQGHWKAFLPQPLRELYRRLFRRQQGRVSLDLCAPAQPASDSPYPFAIQRPSLLDELGEKYGPTKRLHNYLPYYWAHFRDVRLQVRSVLEIGLETDRSIRMWEEFFPNAEIVGVDIDPRCAAFEGGRRRICIGDQGSPQFLASVLARAQAPFDVIIDDGSHRVEHQIGAFNFLFPRMSSHGIYVIEDTGGVVEDRNLATVNALKRLVDSVMHWPRGYPPREWKTLREFGDEASWADRNVVGVAFYRWMVVVLRGRNPSDNPHLGDGSGRG